ncbi:MAG: BrnT family toxin [Desulfovibrionaceae bacterium]|nr:BrnT family toxin [Desulfovibrionaceae bacterium]MBO4794376.1 BrnT family toxin [Deltaproteobacteria bacterium]
MQRFEWDDEKDRANIRKHGVSFEEASTVFNDEYGIFIADPDHSESEDRFLLIGFSETARLLLVCHCYRQSDLVIRIISARKATASEKATYGEQFYA